MHDVDELLARINDRERPVTVFFRDDDVGWANDCLIALCDQFASGGVSLDLALIPGVLDGETEETLYKILRNHGPMVRLHQHGYAHINHQRAGRKCEFGTDRSIDAQRTDIAVGRQRLKSVFGRLIEPVFTPPWNRCTAETCQVLAEFNFEILSRIIGSDEIDLHGLTEVPVTVDWLKKRDKKRLDWPEFCKYAVAEFSAHDVVGIMLHHEEMTDTDLGAFKKFLDGVQRSPWLDVRAMADIAEHAKIESIGRESARV